MKHANSTLNPAPPLVDEITAYDRAHLATYLSLLYATAEGHSEEKMAQDILGIDPVREPVRARDALRSHLARARWLAANGRNLLLEQTPPEDLQT